MSGHGASGKGTGGTATPGEDRPSLCFDSGLVADWTGGTWQGGERPDCLAGFSFDARTLRSGECFVALSGGVRDGHDFVDQARSGGAAGALVERFQDLPLPQLVVPGSLDALGRIGAAVRSGFSGPVVAVTGSCGKTSTKDMLRLALGAERTHATPGNWNNRIGVPMTLLGLDPTRHGMAVIEAGINEPGEMVRLGEMIRADLVIVTHIGAAHLEGLGSEAAIAAEKAQLARKASDGASLVLPAACLRFEAFRELASRATVLVEAGQSPPEGVRETVHFEAVREGRDCSRIRIDGGSGEAEFLVSSLSEGICRNAGLAILAARRLGIADTSIRAGLEAWRPADGRGAIRSGDSRFLYNDAYNANPSSMADALAAFSRAAPPEFPRLYVLAAMEELGPEAPQLHRLTGGRVPLRAGDRVRLVGPEDLTGAYREGLLSAGATSGQIECSESSADFHSEVAQFEGAVFLKGSRHYALEKLLVPPLRP